MHKNISVSRPEKQSHCHSDQGFLYLNSEKSHFFILKYTISFLPLERSNLILWWLFFSSTKIKAEFSTAWKAPYKYDMKYRGNEEINILTSQCTVLHKSIIISEHMYIKDMNKNQNV